MDGGVRSPLGFGGVGKREKLTRTSLDLPKPPSPLQLLPVE